MLDYPSRNESHGSWVSGPGIASFTNVWSPAATCAEAWNTVICQTGDEVIKSWMKFVGERLAKAAPFRSSSQPAAPRAMSTIFMRNSGSRWRAITRQNSQSSRTPVG